MTQAEHPTPAKRKRWGLRTLGFLALGIVALVVAEAQGFHTLGTLGCIAISLAGATYCSIRGWRSMENNEWSRFIRRR